jgi:CheY-like chemotaxis protein
MGNCQLSDHLLHNSRLARASSDCPANGVALWMPPNPTRILLADDDPALQRAVRYEAAKRGYELVEVTRSELLQRTVLLAKPDLIVLDVTFPDADGRDLLAQLKADERTKQTPVLVWSGHHDRESESRIALSLGAEDYVEKTDAQLLMTKIERVLLRLKESAA